MATEIEQERYALKALRGDFLTLASDGRYAPQQVRRVIQAVRR